MSDTQTTLPPLAPGAISAFKTWKTEREKEIEDAEEALCQQLIAAAPESMRKHLRESRQIFRALIKEGRYGQKCSKHETDIEECGLKSVAEFEAGLKALQTAWSPFVRITFIEYVNKFAVEYCAI